MIINRIKWSIMGAALGFITLSGGCKKAELPPPVTGEPVLSFSGVFNNDTINMAIGVASMSGYTSILDDSMNNVRTFVFSFGDYLNPAEPSLAFSFINYKAPFSSVNADLDSTFTLGFVDIATYFPPQSNPLQLNTFRLDYYDIQEQYTSQILFADTSYCRIDSTRDITWKDGNDYKMVYLSLSMTLRRTNTLDSTFFPLTQGKAVLAFPKE
jgi:hypothetical protein